MERLNPPRSSQAMSLVSVIPRSESFKLRLYVAGEAPNSALAMFNLAEMRKTCLPPDCEIEVIDVLENPSRALADRICMTPTLLKLRPDPLARIVGALSDPQRVLTALGLAGRIQ